jgi:GT2 family glycosyltransferase
MIIMKKVAVIIPHYNGIEILDECLKSIENTDLDLCNVYIVDNGSSDKSVEFVENKYTWANIFKLDQNLGYSGGCNYGYEQTDEEYVIFLNNDTIHEKFWIKNMIDRFDSDLTIGAMQPKIRSYYDRELFDYSGSCGGEIDKYGYPFARGRIFETIEKDHGQYDHLNHQEIFWASGTAMMVRRKAIEEVGAFDEDFFAHMEEIDLSWRLKGNGWSIYVEPNSIIYHHSGYTLGKMNAFKMYLNHRNNLFMLYKNLPEEIFRTTMRKRLLFELFTIFVSFVKLDFKRLTSVVKAIIHYYRDKEKFITKRQKILASRKKTSLSIYNHSIVFDYFIKKKTKYSDLTR